MRRNYSQPAGAQTYQRIYSGFRGVDFTNNPLNVDPSRSPYAENIIVDAAGVVHKRPGYVVFHLNQQEYPVNGLYSWKPKASEAGRIAAHEFAYLNDISTSDAGYNHIAVSLPDRPSVGFEHKQRLFLLTGEDPLANPPYSALGFRVIYFDDAKNDYVTKYVHQIATPTETQIAGFWRAEERTELDSNQNQETTIDYTWQFGEKGERNLLTGRRKNTFCGDGEHKTFYLDCPHFKVYKVEQYRYVPDQGSSSTSATVTIMSGTNIRKSPSMNGEIITKTTSQKTAVTTGKTGKWYQIIWETKTAYVHQDRVSSTSGTVVTIATDDKGWEEMTSGYTVSEDDSKHCTKIVFTSAPPAHPQGNGLPNIRVTGAMTELATQSKTASYSGSIVFYIYEYEMMTSIVSVKKNGSTTSSYTTEQDDLGIVPCTVVTVNSVSEGDVVEVVYRRESFQDLELIGKCTIYGKYGEYNRDRIFYTGNPDHPNRDWYSEPSDPTIVLENSYTDIGDQATPIAGYLNYQSDMLIIKNDSNGDNLFRRTASNDGDITIFPVMAYAGRGVTCRKAMANIKGDCVYLSPEGVQQFVSADLGSRYGTKTVSYTINSKLLRENLADAEMGVWGDWLLITFPNGHCYVADTVQQTAPSPNGGYGWEWFYWTGCPFRNMLFSNTDNAMYFSLPNETVGIIHRNSTLFADYPFGEEGEAVPYKAIWSTPQDNLDDPARYKFIETRGAILHFEPFRQRLQLAIVRDGNTVEERREEAVESELTVVPDYDFVEINASPEVPDLTLNRRIHRFKYVQFIFRNDDSNTDGIGLLSMEYQYRFGRYIK